MNRPFFSTAPNSSSNRQPHSQAPPKPLIHERFHSRNTSDPQEYRRSSPIQHRYDDDDTEDAEEDDDIDMTGYGTRSAPSGAPTSRPGSSSKDSGSASKKPKTKSTKVFQCTGYGDCVMQFTRSEHLARHIRKHTGERPFHCDCGRNFSRLDNLRQHMTTVHAQQYPPPSSNAPPARQPPQTKPNGTTQLPSAPHRPSFKNKHRPGPLTLPAQGYGNASPPASPRYKAYSATAAQFPVTYHDPPPSPLATASGNFSGTNSSWHRQPRSALPSMGPLSGGSTSSSGGGSSSSYFSGHLSPPVTGTFPPSPNTAYFGPPVSATYIHQHHPSTNPYDDKALRRQTWHEGNSNGNKLPSIRTIWNRDDGQHSRQRFSPNNFNTSYLRSPVSGNDEQRLPSARRLSLPSQSRPPGELKKSLEQTPEEDDEDYPMNGIDRQGSVSASSGDGDADRMDVDSKKVVSIADLCHPDRGRNDRRATAGGGNTGMDLLSQAAAALIDE